MMANDDEINIFPSITMHVVTVVHVQLPFVFVRLFHIIKNEFINLNCMLFCLTLWKVGGDDACQSTDNEA